ncbi:MAG: hypothetical protein NVS9B15_20410 [Acidobacteriaceae bacterium]
MDEEEKTFCEFRRKTQRSELLSASVEKMLREMRFTGRISMVVKNGTVMKSGYEEMAGQP